jgi:uncharacterized membrane-anchored protein YhcB (DUF1043 family)
VNLDPSTWPALVWLVAAIALLAGYALGTALSRRGRNAERVHELERQLDDTREEFETYREQVSGHFTETSKHLRDLALQYRTVYDHLADGARTLCPDNAVRIEAGGLAEELLPAAARSDVGNPLRAESGAADAVPEGDAEAGVDDAADIDPIGSVEESGSEPTARS